MPRQHTRYNRRTYVFPEDFPQRLKRFQEESGLSWSEIARQQPALEAAGGSGRQPGPRPPVHRLRRRAGESPRPQVAETQKGPHIWAARGRTPHLGVLPLFLQRPSVPRRQPKVRAPRTAAASRVAARQPLPRWLRFAQPPAHAGSDAWPGERVSRAPDTWVRLPTWLSPVRPHRQPLVPEGSVKSP